MRDSSNKVKVYSDLYYAIEKALGCILEGEIGLDDEESALEEFIQVINDNL